MNGILVMNKPQGFTSFDVIGKLRGILKMKKLGHTGTLDPMAAGVLPVLVGNAARACDLLTDETKTYRAAFALGTVTDTQDSTGNVLETHPFSVTEEEITALLPQFSGEIQQIPPMYSAVQINGKRLYELARAGKEIERPARTVFVERFSLLCFDAASGTGEAEIVCGKGTYVRTLLHDLGQALGCGCCMTALTRTKACGFSLDTAHTFEEVQAAADAGTAESLLIPSDTLFPAYPALHLSAAQTVHYQNGVKLSLRQFSGLRTEEDVPFRIYAADGGFLGLAKADRSEGCLRVLKNL